MPFHAEEPLSRFRPPFPGRFPKVFWGVPSFALSGPATTAGLWTQHQAHGLKVHHKTGRFTSCCRAKQILAQRSPRVLAVTKMSVSILRSPLLFLSRTTLPDCQFLTVAFVIPWLARPFNGLATAPSRIAAGTSGPSRAPSWSRGRASAPPKCCGEGCLPARSWYTGDLTRRVPGFPPLGELEGE